MWSPALFAAPEQENFSRVPVVLHVMPFGIARKEAWETHYVSKLHCPCCLKAWTGATSQDNCALCGKIVCDDAHCSRVDVKIILTTGDVWLRACVVCWKLAHAIEKQSMHQDAACVQALYGQTDPKQRRVPERTVEITPENCQTGPAGDEKTLADPLTKKCHSDMYVCQINYGYFDGQFETFTTIEVPSSSRMVKEHSESCTPYQLESWEAVEPAWRTSVDVLHKEVQRLKIIAQDKCALEAAYAQLSEEHSTAIAHSQEVSNTASLLTVTKRNLELSLARVGEQLATTTAKLRDAEKRADELLARAGKAHIRRDWRRMDASAPFPAGDDLKGAFEAPFLQIESFAFEAITSLESLGHEENTVELMVHTVLKPIYERTEAYVANLLRQKEAIMKTEFSDTVPTDLTKDTVTKLFWFTRMQDVIPPLLASLTDEAVAALMAEMGPLVSELHAQMLRDAANDIISNSPNDLRIPTLVRAYLRLFAFVKLSDPYCYLQPLPGARVRYHPERCLEVLSPGARKYGQIKTGDEVEVVHCGLYFEDVTDKFDSVVPVVKCRVRRIVKA